MQALYNILIDIAEVVIAWVVDLVVALFDWVVGFVLSVADQVVTFAIELLPSGITDHLSQDLFAPVLDVFALIDWFVPVYEGFAIISATLVLLGSIRLGRWIIGFIPTVEG